MPDDARELFEEAAAVVDLSRRAGAALARASLEKLLKGLYPDEPKTARLDDYIARAIQELSTPLGMLLTSLRHIGNKSLHVEDEQDDIVALYLGEVDEGIVEILFASINDVVDELVTRPRQATALWGLLPEGVRKAVDEKSKRSK
jgi:hypothetical protein